MNDSQNNFPSLRVAATCCGTTALGPGLRAVVWVQGCPFDCPGCIAPDWIPSDRPAATVQPEALVETLLANPQVTGLTFSGGEPFLQAEGLARLAQLARRKRDLNIICFSGYRLENLLNTPPGRGVFDLLEQVDVLVDGPYIAAQNDGIGLRGSNNQRFHHLTHRLRSFDFKHQPRRVDVIIRSGELLVVGIPSAGAMNALGQVPFFRSKVQSLPGGNYERA